ncbi:lysyl oxidase family protein [Streptomyces jumonjinensis]|uniref:lysyl oxidase family protein n=1 Tax=Streptomyces jumonjinensis TaxID=1945 RepID=UPI003787F8CE
MSRISRKRLWVGGISAASALTVTAGITAAAPAAPDTDIRLIAASPSVTLERYKGVGGEPDGVFLNLGTYLSVKGAPLEFRAKRANYREPIVVQQIIREGGKVRTKDLPEDLVKDFMGLPDFTRVTLTDASGRKVVSKKEAFCPNNASGRTDPGAPRTSRYPEGCSPHPFTLGSVWGVEQGWASNTYLDYYTTPVDVPDGVYTAKISVTKQYRELLGIANEPQTVEVTVRTLGVPPEAEARSSAKGANADHADHAGGHGGHGGHAEQGPAKGMGPKQLRGDSTEITPPPALPYALMKAGRAAVATSGDGPGRTDGSRVSPPMKPAAERPSRRAGVPADAPKPDLRALPAWDIGIDPAREGEPAGRDHLAFASTTWNAGPAPLVVDGFRKPGKGLMDAYQYFYDAQGEQIGYAPSGTMEWDPRDDHMHWHFTDFAAYQLLKADKKEVVRSDKEAFCLASNAAVDYTVQDANWHPTSTDLSTACASGEPEALSVRQALEIGSGDTYPSAFAGQSFDITDVPNGTYWIKVVANPQKRLHETSLDNNTALRKVVLGGEPGARTVQVPAHGLVTSR